MSVEWLLAKTLALKESQYGSRKFGKAERQNSEAEGILDSSSIMITPLTLKEPTRFLLLFRCWETRRRSPAMGETEGATDLGRISP